jgi:transcriptional regulator with XRE-family HTH domain
MRELNQAELAVRAGLQPSAISHFETGTRRPSFDNLRRLADALAVSIDYLLGRSESIGGVAKTADVLYRNIEQLSSRDREVVENITQELVARSKKGDGGGSRT